MSNIVKFKPDAIDTLRIIADLMEDGVIECEFTLINGTDVYHCGDSEENASSDAVFNMTMGIHKLMKAIFEE